MGDLPYMPFFVGDYLADTGHLTAAQHGAYLLLLFHLWAKGSLPQDDNALRQISRMTARQWQDSRETIGAFFGPGWTHERLERERNNALRRSSSHALRGKRGGAAKALKDKERALAVASAQPEHKHSIHTHTQLATTVANGSLRDPPVPNGTGTGANYLLPGLEPARPPPPPPSPPKSKDPESQIFEIGKHLLGKNSGGSIKTLRAYCGSADRTLTLLRDAERKGDSRDYLWKIIRKARERPEMHDDPIS